MNDSSLARKSSSDSSSSELSAVLPDEDACASCFINFLHLRSHAVDAVVDGNNTTIREDAGMMDNDMIDADDDVSMSENNNDANNTTKKSSVRQENVTRPRYPSPSPEDVTSEQPTSTTPPPIPRRRGDSLSIIMPPSSSAESSLLNYSRTHSWPRGSTELQHSSTSLSIPELSQQPLQQSHLISSATNDDDDDAPMLSLDSNMGQANPNEAEVMMPEIPRINLQMRHSNQTITHHHHRVTVTGNDQSRLSATHQTIMETRQSSGRFVPIQNDSREEEDDEKL